MVDNEHAALRLAHPTVVPDPDDGDETGSEHPDQVDVTGSHPTVRAAGVRGD